jgi:hypothetical protein
MTMGTATASGAAHRPRCAAGLGPCLFHRSGFDQKKTLVVHAVVSLRHPSDHPVSDINRIECHITFVPPGEPYTRVYSSESLASHAALARHELLSDIEQYGKELLPVTESQQK